MDGVCVYTWECVQGLICVFVLEVKGLCHYIYGIVCRCECVGVFIEDICVCM